MSKHSAYSSLRNKAYNTTPEEKADLKRWLNEKWLNLSAKITDKKDLPCGTKGKKQKELNIPSICRPSIKINEKTPTLDTNYTDKQIKKAIEIKKKGKMIKWKEL